MKLSDFSSQHRDDHINKLTKEPLDLLVIGGGITGAGIALDAQIRGLKTGLIEMQDFAAGTSSRSTKLVHGGLRYLKQLDIKLVAEVGKEREIVYKNAPHVTKPIWMMLPIYKDGTFGSFSTSLGLKVYDFLAQVNKSERRQMLNQESAIHKEPLLKQEDLKGAGYYVEYRTDDARLTLEVLKEASTRGTAALNYVMAEQPVYENSKLIGVEAVDQLSGKTYTIYAQKIVNAAGPWVDILREKDGSKKGKYLHLTKGVHLVISNDRFPLKEAVYFDTPFKDKRMMFAIPRDGKTYIGTTDTHYTKDITHPKMTKEDRDYILEACNGMFPGLNLTTHDVESSWVGLRPLIHEEGKDPSEISRKDEVFISSSGLITIAGGKLTGYRKMAEKIVDLVTKQISEETGHSYPGCSTERVALSGGRIPARTIQTFLHEQAQIGAQIGLSYEEALILAERYGSNITMVYELAGRSKQEAEAHHMPLEVISTLIYGLEYEMVAAPVDYFIRRTSALFFNIQWVQQWKTPVIQYMSHYFQWSEEQKNHYTDQLEAAITTATEAV
jgi:glycerol-3-phosphate dehydrogenase